MMKTCQVYLARLYYTIAKCTCQEVLRKNIKSKVISPRSITERGQNMLKKRTNSNVKKQIFWAYKNIENF